MNKETFDELSEKVANGTATKEEQALVLEELNRQANELLGLLDTESENK